MTTEAATEATTEADPACGFTPGDLAILEADLAFADAAAPGLGRALMNFLLTGEVAPPMTEMGDLDIGLLNDALTPFDDGYIPSDAPEAERAALAGHKRRAAARYRVFEVEGWDALVAIRYGYVLAIAQAVRGGRQWGGSGSERSPEWLSALFDMEGSRLKPVARPLLTGPRCAEMLALAGLDIEPLVDCLFRTGSMRHQTSHLGMPGLAETLATDLPAVVAAVDKLEPEARLAMIDYLGTSGLVAEPAFLEAALDWAGDGARPVRAAALAALAGAPLDSVMAAAERRLVARDADARLAAVRALVARCGAAALPRLDAHAAGEKAKPVLREIAEARAQLGAAAEGAEAPDGESGYRAADGRWIAAPPRAPVSLGPLAPDAAAALGDVIDAVNAAGVAAFAELERAPAKAFVPVEITPGMQPDVAEMYREMNAERQIHHDERVARERAEVLAGYKPLNDRSAARTLVGVMDGVLPPEAGRRHLARWSERLYEGSLPKVVAIHDRLFAAFLRRTDVGWHHLLRLKRIADEAESRAWAHLVLGFTLAREHRVDLVRDALADRVAAGADVRAISDFLVQQGAPLSRLMEQVFAGQWWRSDEVAFAANMTVWPALERHGRVLDAALGVGPGGHGDGADLAALRALGAYPVLPRRYLRPVLDHAMAGERYRRTVARALLGRVGDLVPLVAPMLEAADAARRIAAARWLAEMRAPAAVPALRRALGRAKALDERAALVTALAACGDGLADLFAEDRLLAEARAGLAKAAEDYGGLFDPAALPVLRWADGRASGAEVAPEVVRWWFAAAHRLKRAGGEPLLHMALDRLDPGDAARLGTAVLEAFVRFDTLRPSVDDAEAAARAGAAGRGRQHRQWNTLYTDEEAHADIRRETLAAYLGSALPHRGLLALARRAPGPEAAAILRRYLRDHSQRTNQCKALVDALAANPAPAALQAVIAVSLRNKTPGVKRYAGEVAARLAGDRGWSADELADRTVPTAGLDEAGGLDLPVGGALWRAVLGDDAVPALLNPAGRPAAALPSAAKGATQEQVEELKAARAALSALRKEVKLTVEAQRGRLHEAMCAGRVWRAADFAAVVLAHPILGRLARRLVLAGFGPDGAPRGAFRALPDGTLTDSDDAPVIFEAFAGVGIAHRAGLGDAAAEAWARHLADYAVVPLFEQLGRPVLAPADGDEAEIADRRGHVIDALALRGAAAALGYARGSIEDGGAFYAYERHFAGAGVAAVVDFSGSSVPERSHPCALHGLRFAAVKAGESGWAAPALPLGRVPPVLLSECWHDYRAVAEAGTGFDPDWERLTAW